MPSKLVIDGFDILDGGMDDATPPEAAVMVNRTTLSINCSHRGGYPFPRPGLRKWELDFQGVTAVETAVTTEMFQRFSVYYPDSGPPKFFGSIGGHMYTIEPYNGFRVNEVSIPGDYDNSFLPWSYYWQCEKWMIKQNAQDRPIIFDGASCRRPAADEIRGGSCGVYAWGRNWYASADGYSYRATDIVWGNGNREDVLKETENAYLNGGGDFVIPSTYGPIRAMCVPGMVDNSLGQGPVMVLAENAVFTNQSPVDRDTWQNLTYPLQVVSLSNYGGLGDGNLCLVNGDVFYRSVDGYRSYVSARRDFGTWGNTSISREISSLIGEDNPGLLEYGSMVLWDNRVISTAIPRLQNGLGITHSGLVVIDFDVISTMKFKDPPAWEGLWTGLDFHQVLVLKHDNDERCFVFARSTRGLLELWEFDPDKIDDGDEVPIEWTFVPRQLTFGNKWQLKRLDGAELFIDELSGTAAFDIKYRTDDNPLDYDWATFSECSTMTTCPTGTCEVPKTLQKQYRTGLALPMPQDICITSTGRSSRSGYKFQPVLTISGSVRVKGMRLFANVDSEAKAISCGNEPCKILEGCTINPYTHRADA